MKAGLFEQGLERTLTRLLLDYFKSGSPDREIFFAKTEGNRYDGKSLGDLLTGVFDLCNKFADLGLKKGDRVAIISENRFEWVVTDFACMFSGVVSVPVYPVLSDSHILYILRESEAKICFVSGSLLPEKLETMKKELPDLHTLVTIRGTGDQSTKVNALKFGDLARPGIPAQYDRILLSLSAMSANISEEDLLTIIYTSGTTGLPKGVMLTHRNFYSNIQACTKVLPIGEDDVFLSFLPYSHSYERTAGYYLALFSRSRIFYAQSIETVSAQLQEVRPTILITVPRLLDKIYNRLANSSDEMKTGLRKTLFTGALEMAEKREVRKGSIKWRIYDKLVFSKIREKTGGRIRFLVSGGGALNRKVGEFFEYLGLTTLEGYGLTETSPVVSVNPPGKNKYGTVGPPLDGVSVKLAEDHEILVSGELIMKGYFKDQKSTEEVISGGWFYTGDIGEIDADGYIKITDRKKSLFKTSGGKYVAPGPLEDKISALPYVESVVVCGNERMFVTALIVPQRNDLLIFAAKNGIVFDDYDDLFQNQRLQSLIQKDIDAVQTDVPGYEKIRRFTLLKEPFTVQSGELTPTLKVKRRVVEKKFAAEIENMYLNI